MKTIRIFPFLFITICVLALLASNTNHLRPWMYHSVGQIKQGSIEPVATFSIVAFDPNTKELGTSDI